MSTVTPADQSAVEGIHRGSTKEQTVSSCIHTEPSLGRQLDVTAKLDAQLERQMRGTNQRPRRLRSTGSRRAAAVAIGLAVASAGFACGSVIPASPTGAARTMSIAPGASPPIRELHASPSPQAFAVAIRKLESQGYVQAACTLKGLLMVNPRTHRSETIPYGSADSKLAALGGAEFARNA